MTPAGQRWTREKPTEPGWYWWRLAPGHYPIIEEYKRDAEGNLVMYVECKGELLKFPLAPGEWLGPITPDSYQHGRVAALDAVERYMAMRLRLAEESLATEILAGNEVKQGRERAAIAELHGMQGHVSDIKENIAQQAQGGAGDGN